MGGRWVVRLWGGVVVGWCGRGLAWSWGGVVVVVGEGCHVTGVMHVMWLPLAVAACRGRGHGGGVSWFVPIFVWPSPPSSDRTTHIIRSGRPDPPDLTGLCLIHSHGLSYASIILLYLVLSILLDYTSTSDLCP